MILVVPSQIEWSNTTNSYFDIKQFSLHLFHQSQSLVSLLIYSQIVYFIVHTNDLYLFLHYSHVQQQDFQFLL